MWQISLQLPPKNNITTSNKLVRNKNYLRILIKWQFILVLNTLAGRRQWFIVWHISSQRQSAVEQVNTECIVYAVKHIFWVLHCIGLSFMEYKYFDGNV